MREGWGEVSDVTVVMTEQAKNGESDEGKLGSDDGDEIDNG